MRRQAEDSAVLGSLCAKGHEKDNTGRSLRNRHGHCIECLRIHVKTWHANNRDKVRSCDINYYKANKEKKCASERARYHSQNGRAKAKERRRRQLSKYRERESLAKKRQRLQSPERNKKYVQEYYKKHTVRIKLRTRIYKAFRQFTTTGKTRPTIEYGIDLQAIIDFLGPCPGTHKEWHIDHIRPLASFDFTDIAQIQAAFAPSNHQWLRAQDNHSKGAKYEPMERTQRSKSK